MKKLLLLISLFFVACSNQATNETQSNNLKIVTTFAPLYSFTSNIALENAEIHNLVPTGTSIHSYQLKPSDLKLISEADLLITNGLHLEEFLDDAIEASGNSDLKIVDTSEGVSLIELDEATEEHEDDEEDHHHEGGNDPHIWLSIDNAIIQVSNVENALIQIDPQNKEKYEANYQNYVDSLSSLKAQMQELIQENTPRNFIVFHDAYQYFLRDFELSNFNKGVIQEFPGKQISPKQFESLVQLISGNEVKIIFTEPQFEPKIIESLKEEFPNLISSELDPIGTSLSKEGYSKLIEENIQNIISAFNQI